MPLLFDLVWLCQEAFSLHSTVNIRILSLQLRKQIKIKKKVFCFCCKFYKNECQQCSIKKKWYIG
jgi:hypothetical protein